MDSKHAKTQMETKQAQFVVQYSFQGIPEFPEINHVSQSENLQRKGSYMNPYHLQVVQLNHAYETDKKTLNKK